MEAARAFAAQRNPNASLGVVFFNSKADVTLGLTRSASDINRVLAREPTLGEGTHIFDALGTAVDELARSSARSKTVVLLTDGDDVGSTTSRDDAISRLEGSTIRVFAVGLPSEAFTATDLQAVASETGGTYAEAQGTEGLTPIFSQIGFRLANEYLLLYRSTETDDKKVNVVVRVAGYAPLETSYTTPALGLTSGPEKKTFGDKLIQSGAFLVFLVAFVVGLVFFGIRAIVLARQRSLRTRMRGFVEMGGDDANPLGREEMTARLERLEESLEGSGFLQRFAERCDIGNVRRGPGTLMLGSFAISAFLAVVLSAAWSPWAILLAPLGPVFVSYYVKAQVTRQQKLFADQLPDNLDVLAQSLRVGHSLIGGLSHMANDAAEPSKREFRRVVTDEQLGIPLEDAMEKIAERMNNRDMEHVALVALLQRETGGASADVIDQVADNIRGRMEVRRLVNTLTAQGRLVRWIVSFMPLALVIMILIVYPAYLDQMFHTTVGILALIFATILVISGSLVIKRIVDIKV
jgi:tight adherence protein B